MPDQNEHDRQRFYRFCDAVVPNREEAARLLVADPILIEAHNGTGETALHYHAIEDELNAVQWLAKCGANVNTQDNFGSSPLMNAASLGHEETCRLLLELGADTRLQDFQGDTALSHAAQASGKSRGVARKQAVVELLLSRVEAAENINDYFDSLSANYALQDGGPVAELLAERGLINPYPE